jgi:hypothetical protein
MLSIGSNNTTKRHCCGHDLTGLAIIALRSIELHPTLLNEIVAFSGSPSMVVSCWPCSEDTGVTQERVASPSIRTVHAPHSAVPQPNLVPVD